MNWTVYVAFSLICLDEIKGHLKVTGRKGSGNVSEMVQDRDIVTADHTRNDTWPIELCHLRWP